MKTNMKLVLLFALAATNTFAVEQTKSTATKVAAESALRDPITTLQLIEVQRPGTKGTLGKTSSTALNTTTYTLDPAGQSHQGTIRVCKKYSSADTDVGNNTFNAVKSVLKEIRDMHGKSSYEIKSRDPEDDKKNSQMCVYLKPAF